ncbi:uncharacterized protein LOC141856304 [Brevipalpus obovatus]|uniref:uncharacterized protein LOC141856304 n=1 Tax=Brevipalpus obovatus TaxID=246614 RepID=UPI003D9F9EE6
MGTCFGKCTCSCCDCLLLRFQSSRLLVHRTAPTDQTFVMREHNSTVEFENLMYDYDAQEPSSSMLRLKPSISSWFKLNEDEYKIPTIKVPMLKDGRKSDIVSRTEETDSNATRTELPIMDPLRSFNQNVIEFTNRTAIENDDRDGCESVLWERESVNSSSDVMNTTELEWDDYDYHDNIFTEETDSLIREIEQMTAKAMEEK